MGKALQTAMFLGEIALQVSGGLRFQCRKAPGSAEATEVLA